MELPENNHNTSSETPATTLRTAGSMPPASPRSRWLSLGVVGAGILIIFAIIVGLATSLSKNSLPGSSLYTIKTKVVEATIVRTTFSSGARVAYNTTLLEARLQELQTLGSDTSTSTDRTLASVAELINTHTEDAIAVLNTETSLSAEERIDASAKLVFVTEAEQTLVDSLEEFTPLRDSVKGTQERATQHLRDVIESFASTSPPESMTAYLAHRLTNLSNDMKQVANGSAAERLALTRVEYLNDALLDGKMSEALTHLLKAQEAIAVDQYLFDSERGPVDGVRLEPTAVPEGS